MRLAMPRLPSPGLLTLAALILAGAGCHRGPKPVHVSTVRVAGGSPRPAAPGAMYAVDHTWSGETMLQLTLPMAARVTERYNGAVAVERGPLVYALKIGEAWTRVNADQPQRELPHGDFEVRPTTPWNYGLAVNVASPSDNITFNEHPVGERPFSPEGAGTSATVRARRLPRWKLENGWAAEISPVDVGWAEPTPPGELQPLEDVTLIPYGCTNIRITEFPRVPLTA